MVLPGCIYNAPAQQPDGGVWSPLVVGVRVVDGEAPRVGQEVWTHEIVMAGVFLHGTRLGTITETRASDHDAYPEDECLALTVASGGPVALVDDYVLDIRLA